MSSRENSGSEENPLDTAAWVDARSLLARQGFYPAPPDDSDDMSTRGQLWELIYAMASRRWYLSCTDHLSDRELLTWLHENWLDEEAADLPPEAEWNMRISPISSGDERQGTIDWLRYYADEEERSQFADDEIPAHEDLPYDRDRFLPDAPSPCTGDCECIEELTDEFTEIGDDDAFEPEGYMDFRAIDSAIAEAHKAEDHAETLDPEASAFDEGRWEAPMKALIREKVMLYPPDEHTEETIKSGLWELLHELACRGFYVQHTDHLTDRDLYETLWSHVLREEAVMPGLSRMAAWYHDFTGSGTEESEEIRLRYYASDAERSEAVKETPGRSLPLRESPVASRDWRLPKGPF